MLVLTRRTGESLVIGAARVTVLGVQANRVTLGIDAPAEVAVWREEARRRERGVPWSR